VEDFLKTFPEAREIFIDGTERPIQRQEARQKRKAHYFGKKHRHTGKNLIISDRKNELAF